MIVSFGDRATEDLYHGRKTARLRSIPADIRSVALRKLDMLNAAISLADLRSPGTQLEALKEDLEGFIGIRINQQWRIIFRWIPPNAFDVQITDYH